MTCIISDIRQTPQAGLSVGIEAKALIAGRPQALLNNPAGQYQLFRIGDAVAGRNIHAAIYDARRLCKDI